MATITTTDQLDNFDLYADQTDKTRQAGYAAAEAMKARYAARQTTWVD